MCIGMRLPKISQVLLISLLFPKALLFSFWTERMRGWDETQGLETRKRLYIIFYNGHSGYSSQSFPPVRNGQISITAAHFTAQYKWKRRRLWIMASSRSKQEPVFFGSRMVTCRGSPKGPGREDPMEELIQAKEDMLHHSQNTSGYKRCKHLRLLAFEKNAAHC